MTYSQGTAPVAKGRAARMPRNRSFIIPEQKKNSDTKKEARTVRLIHRSGRRKYKYSAYHAGNTRRTYWAKSIKNPVKKAARCRNNSLRLPRCLRQVKPPETRQKRRGKARSRIVREKYKGILLKLEGIRSENSA